MPNQLERRMKKARRYKMRLPIREQLTLLIAITALCGLAVLSLATWLSVQHAINDKLTGFAKYFTNSYSHAFVVSVRSQSLSLTADMKASQLASNLGLYQDSIQSIATRVLVQRVLEDFNNGIINQTGLHDIADDLGAALSGGGRDALFLQASIFPRSIETTGNSSSLLNVTGEGVKGHVPLPYANNDGSQVLLGDEGLGYPTSLYPNLTYTDGPTNVSQVQYENRTLYFDSTLILGPLYLNATASLISVTVAINNNSSENDILAWLTVVMDARILYTVVTSPEGLMSTGEILIIGPVTDDNLFPMEVEDAPAVSNSNVDVWFVLPPLNNATLENRHNLRAYQGGNPDLPFKMGDYPAVLDTWSHSNQNINNAGALISSTNEEHKRVSVGYARVPSDLVDWALVFEQSFNEVYSPIRHFRDIVIACLFAVMFAVMLACFPLAHFAVRPVRRLGHATKRPIAVYETDVKDLESGEEGLSADPQEQAQSTQARKEGFFNAILPWNQDRTPEREGSVSTNAARRHFHIPEKVPEKSHFIHDELTDLTSKFNEMSDELTVQYSRLQQRVRERTVELEKSRDAEKAANESKTLFIANISHELRTPLNGILGMCATSMHETHIDKVRQSLKIIYKSGDLLLHLLTDLLTFSSNHFGQQLTIESNGFRLAEIGMQLSSIFEKQARNSRIDLKVLYLGAKDSAGSLNDNSGFGPSGTGLVKDMCLMGDKNRILQVLMNLISNSLKFTPEGGSVELRLRCVGMEEEVSKAASISNFSIHSVPKNKVTERLRSPLGRRQPLSDNAGEYRDGLGNNEDAISIDEMAGQKKNGRPRQNLQRSTSARLPVSLNSKKLMFDFEVEDTGPGIPEHMQEEIFKPFMQGDLALSKKYGGTGLGLSICSQLATLMGGKITLKSALSVGSTFTMRIPLLYVKELPLMSNQSFLDSVSTFKTNSVMSHSLRNPRAKSPAVTPRITTMDQTPSIISAHSTHSNDSTTIHAEVPRIVGFSQPYLADVDQPEETRSTVQLREEPEPDEEEVRTEKKEKAKIGTDAPIAKAKKLAIEKAESPPEGERKEPETEVPKTQRRKEAKVKAESSKAKEMIPKIEVEAPETRSEKPRVLVAEDNKVNQQVILRMLKLEGISDIIIAEDGQIALDMVSKSMEDDEPENKTPQDPSPSLSSPSLSSPSFGPSSPSSSSSFSLIFMDIQMPNMDGIQATKLIRERGFFAPIIALTAYAEEANRIACIEAGMNHFLPKPIKRSALKPVLKQFLPL